MPVRLSKMGSWSGIMWGLNGKRQKRTKRKPNWRHKIVELNGLSLNNWRRQWRGTLTERILSHWKPHIHPQQSLINHSFIWVNHWFFGFIGANDQRRRRISDGAEDSHDSGQEQDPVDLSYHYPALLLWSSIIMLFAFYLHLFNFFSTFSYILFWILELNEWSWTRRIRGRGRWCHGKGLSWQTS